MCYWTANDMFIVSYRLLVLQITLLSKLIPLLSIRKKIEEKTNKKYFLYNNDRKKSDW